MYENGRQTNRYANKVIHKRKQKDRYRRRYFGGYRGASWEDFAAHAPEWERLRYWRDFYLSGPRRFAKACTSRKLRAQFREEVAHTDYEDMHAPQRAEYQKYFDYAWAVW